MSNKKKLDFNKKCIIGAIHFPPLLGYSDFPGVDVARENALLDLKAFENGGVDAVVIENNYDIPHKATVDASVVASMTYLGAKIVKKTKLPVGISVLWNDFETALSIAKILGLAFIRVPVFVDQVKTTYGIMEPQAQNVVAFRKKIEASDILLFTDIHVKHAEILSKTSIEQSAKNAIEAGSDGLIVTGNWTGDAPDLEELRRVRQVAQGFPIFIGSGADENNAKDLFKFANGAIVSTSLKEGEEQKHEINVKLYDQRIDENKVRRFVDKKV